MKIASKKMLNRLSGIVIAFAMVALIVCFLPTNAYAARSWIVGNPSAPMDNDFDKNNTTNYGSIDKTEAEAAAQDPATKAISRVIVNFGSGLDEEDLNASGNMKLTFNTVILGNLSGGISFAKFGLEKGNPYGIISAHVYVIIRNIVYLLMFLYCTFLIVSSFFYNNAKSRAMLKDAIANTVIMFFFLYAMPVLVNYFILVRDYVTGAIFGDLLGGQSFNLTLAADNLLDDSRISISYAIMWVALRLAPLIYLFPYVVIALSEMALFMIFPIIALASIKNKKLMSVWAGNFFSYLLVPFLDVIFLCVPMFVKIILNNYKISALTNGLIVLACIWGAQAARNSVIKLLGGSLGVGMGASPLASFARTAAMMGRMAAMRGMAGSAGGNGGSGNGLLGDIAESKSNAARAGEFGDSVKDITNNLNGLPKFEEDANGNIVTAKTGGDQVNVSDVLDGMDSVDARVNEVVDEAAESSTAVESMGSEKLYETPTNPVIEESFDGDDVSTTSTNTDVVDGQSPVMADVSASEGQGMLESVAESSSSMETTTKADMSDDYSKMETFENKRLKNLEQIDMTNQAIDISKDKISFAKADLADWQRVQSANAQIQQLNDSLGSISQEHAAIFGHYDSAPGGARIENLSVADRARVESLDKRVDTISGRIGEDGKRHGGTIQQLEADREQAYRDIASRHGTTAANIKNAVETGDWGNYQGPRGVSEARNNLDDATRELANNQRILEKRQNAERSFASVHQTQAGGDGKVYANADTYRAVMANNEYKRKVATWRNFDSKADSSYLTPEQKAQYYTERAKHNATQRVVSGAASAAGAFIGVAAGAYAGADASMSLGMWGASSGQRTANKIQNTAGDVVDIYKNDAYQHGGKDYFERMAEDDRNRYGFTDSRRDKPLNDSNTMNERLKKEAIEANQTYQVNPDLKK